MKKFFNILFVICFTVLGAVITLNLTEQFISEVSMGYRYGYVIAFTVVFAVIGLLIAPPIINSIERVIDKGAAEFSKKSLYEIIPGIVGLIIGLIVASLFSVTIAKIDPVGPYLAVILELVLGYLGFVVGYRKRDDFNGILPLRRDKDRDRDRDRGSDRPLRERRNAVVSPMKILDSSVIIDGRIADIYRTGFLEGQLVIAGFVLEELQHIADSSDALKRNRGRVGLDSIKMMQNEFGSSVMIYNKDYSDTTVVDAKLLLLAKDLNGVVVTNDYNLNKVAQVQGVKVLNINDLANSVKPVLLPGEDLTVSVVREGKEHNQGIAYLDDGTMIVVENGRRFVGSTIFVIVTSILQTSAGRMIFAKPKILPLGDGCD